jgi:uncharacterized protein YwgA
MAMQSKKSDWQKAAEIVRDAGGQIVGRTRLQKVAYLLELAGLGDGFPFEYFHYGPYSEELAQAISVANAYGVVDEEERPASWGGLYSVYTTRLQPEQKGPRTAFVEEAAKIGAIALELAATAAYLRVVEGVEDAWKETARRKPEKVRDGHLEEAKAAYERLLQLETPTPLPRLI